MCALEVLTAILFFVCVHRRAFATKQARQREAGRDIEGLQLKHLLREYILNENTFSITLFFPFVILSDSLVSQGNREALLRQEHYFIIRYA